MKTEKSIFNLEKEVLESFYENDEFLDDEVIQKSPKRLYAFDNGYDDDNSSSCRINTIRKRENQLTPKLEDFRQWYEVDSLNKIDSLKNRTDNLSKLPFTTTRYVKRNLPNCQSDNIFALKRRSIMRRNESEDEEDITFMTSPRWFDPCLPRNWLMSYWSIFLYDWFHYFLRWHTYWAMLAWSTLWTLFVLVFALIYYGLDHSVLEKDQCKLSAGYDFTFSSAFGFSLLTTTTVGYTLPGGTNAFFEKCPVAQIAIYGQCIIALLFNTLLISFLYTRISRAERRSCKLLFSNQAIIRPIVFLEGNGAKCRRWTFEFRVFDLDASHPTVESHVRIYAYCHGNASRHHIQELKVCRTLRPSDTLEGWVFTSVPYTVVHEIDIFSPLCPSFEQPLPEFSTWFNGHHGLDRRASEARTLQTAAWICPSCSMPCADSASLQNHIKYMKIKNMYSKMDRNSHLSIPDDYLNFNPVTFEMIKEDLLRKHLENIEIICVVEGIEPITSGTFQALQSYTLGEIVFNGSFKRCLDVKDDEFVVDLDAFHEIFITSPSTNIDVPNS